MKKILSFILLGLVFSGCSTMQPPRYAISVDNIQKMKTYAGAKVEFSILSQSASFEPSCRMMGPIEPADGMTISQFITKAFNDEFKMAEIHSSDGVKITGDITKVEFSSTESLTNGYWDIALSLKSTNGESMLISNKYTFKSGFDAITACNATADALSPAIQDLIKVTVHHPEFKKLIN